MEALDILLYFALGSFLCISFRELWREALKPYKKIQAKNDVYAFVLRTLEHDYWKLFNTLSMKGEERVQDLIALSYYLNTRDPGLLGPAYASQAGTALEELHRHGNLYDRLVADVCSALNKRDALAQIEADS